MLNRRVLVFYGWGVAIENMNAISYVEIIVQ